MVAFGGGTALLIWRSQSVFLQSINRDLIQRATRFGRGPMPGFGGGPGLGPGPFGGRRPQFNDPPNDDVNRPALFDLQKKPLNQREFRFLDPESLRIIRPNQNWIISTRDYDGKKVQVITAPIRAEGEFMGYVQFGYDLAEYQRLVQTQSQVVFFVLPFLILGSAVAGYFLSDRAIRPIKQITARARQVSAENLSGERLPESGDQELVELGQTFNQMLQRLEMSFEDLQATLERQKRFVADASHELRTPLSRLRITTSSALQQDSTEQELRRSLEIADKAGLSMTRLVEQLLSLARLDKGGLKMERVSLSEVASSLKGNYSSSVSFELDNPGSVLGDPLLIERAVTNLIDNGLRYAENVIVQVASNQIVVSDNGPGIPSEHLEHLGERFYRVDEARNRRDGGTGLGLSIVKQTMEVCGGTFKIESEIGKGTKVTLSFASK